MAFTTDQILWYNNGIWGELGYAVPNLGNDPTSCNAGILYLASVVGRNLSAIMQSPDVDLRKPPTINALIKVHKTICRARQIMSGREVPPSQPQMQATHNTPSPQDHIIYPVPYFLARNGWLKEYCGLILGALCEAVQHTDNRNAFDFSTDFSGTIGQYLFRVYRLMATELFQVPAADASKLDFVLTDAQLAAYNPSLWFTQTELIDTLPAIATIPTEDDLVVLTDGIPATQLVNVVKWPSGGAQPSAGVGTAGGNVAAAQGAAASFAAPPGP